MPKSPKTFDELTNHCNLDEREALAAAAILPNLPSGEALVAIRGYGHDRPGGPWYNTDADERESFERRHKTIVPGGELYRTKVPESKGKYDVGVEPVPHPWRTYRFEASDLLVITPVDPDDYDFDDVPIHRLDDFGCGSPYFNPYEANRDAFPRDPALPV